LGVRRRWPVGAGARRLRGTARGPCAPGQPRGRAQRVRGADRGCASELGCGRAGRLSGARRPRVRVTPDPPGDGSPVDPMRLKRMRDDKLVEAVEGMSIRARVAYGTTCLEALSTVLGVREEIEDIV